VLAVIEKKGKKWGWRKEKTFQVKVGARSKLVKAAMELNSKKKLGICKATGTSQVIKGRYLYKRVEIPPICKPPMLGVKGFHF